MATHASTRGLSRLSFPFLIATALLSLLALTASAHNHGVEYHTVTEGGQKSLSGHRISWLDLLSAAEQYVVPVAKGGVGNADRNMTYKDMVVVIGDIGVSTFNSSAGDLVPSCKCKKCDPEDHEGYRMILKTASAAIACFDLDDRTYKQFKARTGSSTSLYQFAVQIHPIYLLFFRITSPRRSSRSYGYATTSSDRPAKK